MTEYAAYLDVAGHPDAPEQGAICIAGFIASEAQWLEFKGIWKGLLAKHSLGSAFHMTDFEADKKRSRSEKDAILTELITAIKEHTRAHVFCGVEMKTYKKVNEEYALDQFIGTPYAVIARGVVRHIRKWKSKFCGKRDRVLVFVEDGTRHHGDMEDAFRRDKLPVPNKVPKNMPAVQPADLFAWEGRNALKSMKIRETLKYLVASDPRAPKRYAGYDGFFSEQNLIKGCKQVSVPLRREIPGHVKVVYRHSPKQPRKRIIK